MTLNTQQMTVEEFDVWVERDENTDKLFEYIGGEIVEVPSNPLSSKIAINIATHFRMYTFSHDIGHVTGEQGGFMVSGERYAPDVAFTSYATQAQLVDEGYNPNPPDLAVEVVSSNRAAELASLSPKVHHYLLAGVVVWVVHPSKKQVHVYKPNETLQVFNLGETLTEESILPGFKLKVDDVFAGV